MRRRTKKGLCLICGEISQLHEPTTTLSYHLTSRHQITKNTIKANKENEASRQSRMDGLNKDNMWHIIIIIINLLFFHHFLGVISLL
jgi:hypothetical protein